MTRYLGTWESAQLERKGFAPRNRVWGGVLGAETTAEIWLLTRGGPRDA